MNTNAACSLHARPALSLVRGQFGQQVADLAPLGHKHDSLACQGFREGLGQLQRFIEVLGRGGGGGGGIFCKLTPAIRGCVITFSTLSSTMATVKHSLHRGEAWWGFAPPCALALRSLCSETNPMVIVSHPRSSWNESRCAPCNFTECAALTLPFFVDTRRASRRNNPRMVKHTCPDLGQDQLGEV